MREQIKCKTCGSSDFGIELIDHKSAVLVCKNCMNEVREVSCVLNKKEPETKNTLDGYKDAHVLPV